MSTETLFLLGKPSDEINNLFALLTEYGYQVYQSNYDQKIVHLLESTIPDLILLSFSEHPDCYTLCQYLKSSEPLKHIPIIFIANKDHNAFNPMKAFQVGGSDYFLSPFGRDEIITRIKNQLTIVSLQKEVKDKQYQLKQALQAYHSLNITLRKTTQKIAEISKIDQLTQLPNRVYLEEYLHQEWLRCAREQILWNDASQASFSLILCVLTNINTEQIYNIKQHSLQQIAELIRQVAKRPADFVCCYDIGQFIVLLPNTNEYGAQRVANLIGENLQQLNSIFSHSQQITFSLAIATDIPSQAIPANTLIKNAFERLHEKER